MKTHLHFSPSPIAVNVSRQILCNNQWSQRTVSCWCEISLRLLWFLLVFWHPCKKQNKTMLCFLSQRCERQSANPCHNQRSRWTVSCWSLLWGSDIRTQPVPSGDVPRCWVWHTGVRLLWLHAGQLLRHPGTSQRQWPVLARLLLSGGQWLTYTHRWVLGEVFCHLSDW